MPTRDQPWLLAVFAFAIAWHLLAVAGAWTDTHDVRHGRDFASYHYAVEAAAAGDDPYDTRALAKAARQERIRRGVHPYLYAPPFLLLMAWTEPLPLPDAFHAWFWIHACLGVLTALGLAWWWRSFGGDPLALFVMLTFALMTAVPNNHQMGQANFAGLGLALGGLALVERGRAVPGGALMGAACMLKMSPALFVMWWMLRREWLAVGIACATGLVLSVAALPWVGLDVQ
ncbi:MAG: glycosyltransferase family 87 protein, partial [Myxococcota bacterium]